MGTWARKISMIHLDESITGCIWPPVPTRQEITVTIGHHSYDTCHETQLSLFPAAGLLAFLAMVILGTLTKKNSFNPCVFVLTDRYMKLKMAIKATKIKSTSAPTIFAANCGIAYSIPTYLLTDSGPHSVSKLFEAVISLLEIKLLTKSAYNTQIKGQVETFNRTIFARPRHYAAGLQTDWD